MSWLSLNTQAALAKGNLIFPEKEVTTEGCHYHFTPKLSPSLNVKLDPSLNVTDIIHTDEILMMYRLSYLWYTLIGCAVSVTVALIISFLTKPNDPRDIDPGLLAPIVRKFIPEREFPNQPNSDGIIWAYEPTPVYVNNGLIFLFLYC